MIKTLLKIANAIKNPALIYSEEELLRNLSIMQDGLNESGCKYKIYYAVKSCYERKVLNSLFKNGCGAEVMSDIELDIALKAHKSPDIMLNGIGRSEGLFKKVIDINGQIIIDSLGDFKRLKNVVLKLKNTVKVGIRIRPQLLDEGSLSSYRPKGIKLGLIPFSDEFNEIIKEIEGNKKLELKILHAHFSINEENNSKAIFVLKEIEKIYKTLLKRGFGKNLEAIDIGGGFSPFDKSERFKAYKLFKDLGKQFSTMFPGFYLYLEPGRYLTNSSGYVIGKVTDIKHEDQNTFVFTNASTNVLIPIPTARYKLIYPKPEELLGVPITIVDGITSPDNVILKGAKVKSIPKVGDWVFLGNCGAYTSVLQHFWVYDPFPIYFLTLEGKIIETFTKSDIIKARNKILKI